MASFLPPVMPTTESIEDGAKTPAVPDPSALPDTSGVNLSDIYWAVNSTSGLSLSSLKPSSKIEQATGDNLSTELSGKTVQTLAPPSVVSSVTLEPTSVLANPASELPLHLPSSPPLDLPSEPPLQTSAVTTSMATEHLQPTESDTDSSALLAVSSIAPEVPASQDLPHNTVTTRLPSVLPVSSDPTPSSTQSIVIVTEVHTFSEKPTSSSESFQWSSSSTEGPFTLHDGVVAGINSEISDPPNKHSSATSPVETIQGGAIKHQTISTNAVELSGVTASESQTLVPPVEDTTFVIDGTTLTGTAAVAALAAAGATNEAGEPEGEHVEHPSGSKLSSFAIVGIVAGALIGIIILYVVWFQWRKKRRAASNKEDDSAMETKTEARSSSGHDPFMDRISAYPETWYREDRLDQGGSRHVEADGQYRYDGQGMEDALVEELEDERRSGPDPFDDRYSRQVIDRSAALESRRLSSEAWPQHQKGCDEPPHAQRDTTSRADSYAYNSIYAGYANSEGRSRTQTMHDLDPKTPSTSTLLPWLHADQEPQPPLPSLPESTLRRGNHHMEPNKRPSPPRPAMARSPTIHGGWEGVIPPFR